MLDYHKVDIMFLLIAKGFFFLLKAELRSSCLYAKLYIISLSQWRLSLNDCQHCMSFIRTMFMIHAAAV